MGVASGIGAQVGIIAESTYGTYIAPTKFLLAEKIGLKKVKNTVQPKPLRAGTLGLLSTHRRVTTLGGTGTIDLDVVNKGFGLLLQTLMGTTVTPVQQGATTAYLQTHTLADPVGKSLTIQAGVPDTTGSVKPFSFLGCKLTDGTFTFEVNKEVTATFSVDAKDVSESQGIATASFVTGVRPFVGTDTGIKVGTYGAEAAVTGVRKASVKIDRGLKTDRYYLGASGLKAEPVIGDFWKITGTINADFVDKTIWADRFAADTGFSLVLEAVGQNIATTYYDTFRITLPGCYLDGDTPMADSPDIINGDFPYTGLFDGTNLPKIEYISTDTTV